MLEKYRLEKLLISTEDYPQGYIVKVTIPKHCFELIKIGISELDYVFEVKQRGQILTIYFDLFRDSLYCYQSLEHVLHTLTR